MVITDQAQFEQLVQEVRDQILSESQGVGEVDIVDNLDSIYSLPALKLNDDGDQVVEAPLSLLSAPAEEAAATANAAAQAANTAAESANSAASSANQVVEKTNTAISNATLATQKAEASAEKANTAAQSADEVRQQFVADEEARVQAENERVQAEQDRATAEQARVEAETTRVEAESQRASQFEQMQTDIESAIQTATDATSTVTEAVSSAQEAAESANQAATNVSIAIEDATNATNAANTAAQSANAAAEQATTGEQARNEAELEREDAELTRHTEYETLKARTKEAIADNQTATEGAYTAAQEANTAAKNANAAIANMENTYAKKDEIPDVSEFVTTTVDNLVNYYKKSETYTKEEINGLIGSTSSINFKVVDSLPETGESNIIYLVPSSKQEEKNVKDEYIWVDDSWELIGSTKIDLSNYYTRDEVNSTFALKTELAWDTITGKPVWIGSSKPTYTWSEINEKPTTLAGYGITDSYTKTESDERYVNTTGDTMSGALTINHSGINPIYLNSSSTEHCAIIIKSNTSTKANFGWFHAWGAYMSDASSNRYINIKSDGLYWNNQYSFLHTGNYTSALDTRYVLKSGDTMTGALNIMLLSLNDNEINSSNALYLGYRSTPLGVNVCHNNTPFTYGIGRYTIWHAGNDGSGSGLDADLLDGVHYQNILERVYSKVITLESTGWYRIVRTISGNNGGISFKLFLVREYNYGTNESYSFDIAINHNSNSASIVQTSGYANMRFIKKIRVTGDNNSHQYVDIYYDHTYLNNIRWTTIGCAESIDAEKDVEALTYTTEFETTNGCKSSLGFVGALTGNADTTTKLQTPRTIWGQSFDGTENVDGNMIVTGNISASGGISSNKSGTQFLSIADTNQTACYRLITGFSIWDIATTGANDDFSLRFVYSTKTKVLITYDGNMGIGTDSPDYNLDVSGDIRATGNIIGTVSSDIQLKTILNTIDYQDKLLSLGDVVEYEYNEIAFNRSNSSTLQHRTYTGLIYQNVKDVLPSMAYEDQDGYGCLNYLSYDYINLIAGALQQTITKQKQLEKRISILEEENINLKQQLSN